MQNKFGMFILLAVVVVGGYFLVDKSRTVAPELISELSEDVIPGSNKEVNNIENNDMQNEIVTMKTSLGDIKIELFMEARPVTAGNFLKLAKEGFYDEVKFHRVIKNFMNQAGDPNSKDDSLMAVWGTGGPGYTIDDEFQGENLNVRGSLSMANAGPNSGGSQFFINVADNNSLDEKHSVFGIVVEGMDVVDEINLVETGQGDVPVEPVVITGFEI